MSGVDNKIGRAIFITPQESVALSWLRDTYSFGGLAGAAWFLNTQMPPSGWLNAALAIAWMLWMLGKSGAAAKRVTPDEARAWLDEHYPLSPAKPKANSADRGEG